MLAECFGAQSELCRGLPCCVCQASPPSDPHHVVSRGAGGKDAGNAVPLCRFHHGELHTIGLLTFQEKHSVNLRLVASHLLAHCDGPEA